MKRCLGALFSAGESWLFFERTERERFLGMKCKLLRGGTHCHGKLTSLLSMSVPVVCADGSEEVGEEQLDLTAKLAVFFS